MTTPKKKPAASDPLVAAETILIEGKPFMRGEKIAGVAKDEIDRAVRQRRVIRKSVFEALGETAPELTGHETDMADADETEGLVE